VSADVTLYRENIKPLVAGKVIRIDEEQQPIRRIELTGLGDKGFDGEETLLTPHKGRGLSELQSIFNAYINQPRTKVENSYSRLKSNFNFWGETYRTSSDEPRYDRMCWFSAQLTEIDSYYRPIRREILSEMEQFL